MKVVSRKQPNKGGVWIAGIVRRQTDKAILIEPLAGAGKDAWLPKSCIMAQDRPDLVIDGRITVKIPQWLAIDKNLIENQ